VTNKSVNINRDRGGKVLRSFAFIACAVMLSTVTCPAQNATNGSPKTIAITGLSASGVREGVAAYPAPDDQTSPIVITKNEKVEVVETYRLSTGEIDWVKVQMSKGRVAYMKNADLFKIHFERDCADVRITNDVTASDYRLEASKDEKNIVLELQPRKSGSRAHSGQ
jgi:hypothetical protein